MSRYCASCGKLLADNAKFCTSCGAPVEQTAASDSQPAFEQTGSLDTPQAKAGRPPRLSPRPRRRPRGRRDHAAHTRRERLAPTAAGSRIRARFATDPRSQKERHRPLIAVIVVLVAIIIALVVFFVIKPFDNAATQTTPR